MKFPSITTSVASQRFWYIIFRFSFVSRYSFISPLISSITFLWFFHFSSCNWFLVLYYCGWKNAYMLSIFLNLFGVVLGPNVIYPGKCFMWTWQECVFCNFWMACSLYILLSPSGLTYLKPMFPYQYHLDYLSIDISGVLMLPTIILWSISLIKSFNICFIYFSASMPSTYMFINAVSSC